MLVVLQNYEVSEKFFDHVEIKFNNEVSYLCHGMILFKGKFIDANSLQWKNYLKQQQMLKLRKSRY